MTRTRWQAALVLFAVFALGNVLGAALMHAADDRSLARVFDGPPEAADVQSKLFLWDRALGLDETQRTRVLAILRAHQPEILAARRSAEPQLAPVRARQRAEIRALLTDAQRAKFDRFTSERDAWRQRSL